jgi:hypothetical protein
MKGQELGARRLAPSTDSIIYCPSFCQEINLATFAGRANNLTPLACLVGGDIGDGQTLHSPL